jgi:hypothetical protein
MNKGLTPNAVIIDETTLDPIKDDWRPIPGFDGYEINRAGEVYSLKSEKFMATHYGANTPQVKLAGHGHKRYTRSVPKLIDLAFPEFKKESSTPNAQVVIDYIKEAMHVELMWWQKYRLEQWILAGKKKNEAEAA